MILTLTLTFLVTLLLGFPVAFCLGITSLAALDILGPDFRFKTEFYLSPMKRIFIGVYGFETVTGHFFAIFMTASA